MARVTLNYDEMLDGARTQIRQLLQACERFDAGDQSEHLTIATKLRVLLHHTTGKSKAVLEYFDALDAPWWVASGNDMFEEDVLTRSTLTHIGRLGSRHWEARLDDFGELPVLPLQMQIRQITSGRGKPRSGGYDREFDDWWTQPVIRDGERNEFTRQEVVTYVANQDGGAHVDRNVDTTYYRLSRLNAMGMKVANGIPKDSPVPATVRQIGWEIHAMLMRHLPSLVPEGFTLASDRARRDTASDDVIPVDQQIVSLGIAIKNHGH